MSVPASRPPCPGPPCPDKEGFEAPYRAYEVARRMIRSGRRVQPYRCALCGLFHVARKETR